jgi:hypothetical protein
MPDSILLNQYSPNALASDRKLHRRQSPEYFQVLFHSQKQAKIAYN